MQKYIGSYYGTREQFKNTRIDHGVIGYHTISGPMVFYSTFDRCKGERWISWNSKYVPNEDSFGNPTVFTFNLYEDNDGQRWATGAAYNGDAGFIITDDYEEDGEYNPIVEILDGCKYIRGLSDLFQFIESGAFEEIPKEGI